MHQAVLRRLREVAVLSVVRSPAPDDRCGWPELDQAWETVVRPPTPGVLGSARILQARLADPAAALNPTDLGPGVAAATGMAGAWSATGVLRQAKPLGPFAMWEVLDPLPRTDWDTRTERRLVVVAPADRDDWLSAWTWSRGTPELAPFATYLLHAAKVRYGLRVWAAAADRALRSEVEREIGPLLQLTEKVADSGREPDVSALSAASARLVRLQAGELGLVVRTSRLREMRRSVEIAERNMAAYVGSEEPTGLFADDAALAGWAVRQLDNDATYLEAALDRARSVAPLVDQLVRRGVQDRRERFNLGLTGLIGAVLMALAAMQTLRLEFTLPKPLLGGVVCGLAALALLVPVLLLRQAAPGRVWSALLVCVGVGLLAATVPWIALTVAAHASGTATSALMIVSWGVGAALSGAALAGLSLHR